MPVVAMMRFFRIPIVDIGVEEEYSGQWCRRDGNSIDMDEVTAYVSQS